MTTLSNQIERDWERLEAEQRFTIADLEAFTQEGLRYELINGELHVSKQPHWHHQITCRNIEFQLHSWNRDTQLGIVLPAPGIIYDEYEAVAPDVVWIRRERMPALLAEDGKLHHSPDLVVEVLSLGAANEKRDREAKRSLYARRGVQEYWIADWRNSVLEMYRRQGETLALAQTLRQDETVTAPLLPGFACLLSRFFEL
jgi:Uma2 family endonuclease